MWFSFKFCSVDMSNYIDKFTNSKPVIVLKYMSLDRSDHFIFQMTIWYTLNLYHCFYKYHSLHFMNDVSIWISVLWFPCWILISIFFSGTIKYVRNSSIHFFLSWRLLGEVMWTQETLMENVLNYWLNYFIGYGTIRVFDFFALILIF